MLLLLAARAALAGVFAVAASAKLTDRAGLRRSMAAFGIPAVLVRPLGRGLVAGELCVAALVCSPAAAAGAAAALALLAAFSLLVVAGMRRGQAPECHCFGPLSRGRAGWPTVARNAGLMAVAGYVAVGGRAPAVFAGLGLAAVVLRAVPRLAQIRGRAAPAPDFALADPAGRAQTLASVLADGKPVLLVFTRPSCGPCQALLPDVARWQHELRHRVSVLVISSGPEAGGPEAATLGPGTVLADQAGTVARAYGVQATPSAVLIGRDGHTAAPPARGAGEIDHLIRGLPGQARRPGQPRPARRTLLRLAAAGILPLAAAACGTSRPTPRRPKALHVDGAWLCDQRYALCTDAPCTPDPDHPGIVICDCVVTTGYAIGFKSCADRAPAAATVYSNFSTQLVTDHTQTLTCSADNPWANCLDVICTTDPHDPATAHCQCLLTEHGPSVTFGGRCDTRTCSSVIWSAATPDLPGSSQLEKGMKQLGLPLTLPQPCPSR